MATPKAVTAHCPVCGWHVPYDAREKKLLAHRAPCGALCQFGLANGSAAERSAPRDTLHTSNSCPNGCAGPREDPPPEVLAFVEAQDAFRVAQRADDPQEEETAGEALDEAALDLANLIRRRFGR